MAGVVYDSKKEARRAAELQWLEKVGAIRELKRQQKFVLQPGFVNNKGKRIRAIAYVADFTYITPDGKQVAEDTKGVLTDVYKIKRKLFEYKYRDWTLIES